MVVRVLRLTEAKEDTREMACVTLLPNLDLTGYVYCQDRRKRRSGQLVRQTEYASGSAWESASGNSTGRGGFGRERPKVRTDWGEGSPQDLLSRLHRKKGSGCTIDRISLRMERPSRSDFPNDPRSVLRAPPRRPPIDLVRAPTRLDRQIVCKACTEIQWLCRLGSTPPSFHLGTLLM